MSEDCAMFPASLELHRMETERKAWVIVTLFNVIFLEVMVNPRLYSSSSRTLSTATVPTWTFEKDDINLYSLSHSTESLQIHLIKVEREATRNVSLANF
jgi:hypothetical protein